MVGCEDQHVVIVEQAHIHLGDGIIDHAQRVGEAGDVVAVAKDLVGVDEVRKDEARVKGPDQLADRGDRLHIGRARMRDVHADTGEKIPDLADTVDA